MGVKFQILKFDIFIGRNRYAAYPFRIDTSYVQQFLYIFSCTAWARRRLSLQNCFNTWPFACRSCLRVCNSFPSFMRFPHCISNFRDCLSFQGCQ